MWGATADKARQEREEAEARRQVDELRRQELQEQAAQEAAGRYTVVDNETGEIMEQQPKNDPEPVVYQAPKPTTDARRVRLVLDMVAPSAEHVKHLKQYLESNGWTYEQQQAHYMD